MGGLTGAGRTSQYIVAVSRMAVSAGVVAIGLAAMCGYIDQAQALPSSPQARVPRV